MTTRRRPALTVEQWRKRSTGIVSINSVGDELHLIVRGPRDELTSVSDADDLWRLIALANEALPEADMRKVTTDDVVTLRLVAASIRIGELPERSLIALADMVCEKLSALLPPGSAR